MDSDFSCSILPEDPVPEIEANCTRCELCNHSRRIVWGEGNVDAPITILLDNPGLRENKEGAPFLCGTRQTMQSLALKAGLKLEHLYITYVVKCRPVRSYNKEQARAICLAHFRRQVEMHKPEVIFCLGNVSIQALFSDAFTEVKGMHGRWHNWDGYPLAVSYHPLAVRRRPNLMSIALQDWVMVAKRIQQGGYLL